MKLLVIFTGGTIGSSLKEGWISPDGNAKKQLIAQYQRLDDSVELVPLSLYEILSENLSAKRLNMLIDCLLREEEGALRRRLAPLPSFPQRQDKWSRRRRGRY